MHRQIKHRNRIIEGLSAKEAIPKGSHSRQTSHQKVGCLYEKRKPNSGNSDLIKFLTDDNSNKHYFLVIINMHHERQLSNNYYSCYVYFSTKYCR